MRITGFRAENFKRLKAVEINPDGTTVVIAGRNAQGKSSVLDGIWAALAGKAGSKEVVQPIREGEKRASVVVELDDLRVERKWTPGGSTLTVGPKDGSAKFNSPQAILDKLIGSLSFDPLAFAEADAKTQRKMLLDLTGLADTVESLDRQRKAAYDERTDVNRDAKRLKSLYERLEEFSEPVEPVDGASLVAEAEKAERKERLLARWNEIADEIKALEEERERIAHEGRSIGGVSGTAAELRQRLIDMSEINARAARHQEWVEVGRSLQDAKHASLELTEKVDQADISKVELLAQAPLPVPGLSVDEDGVLLNGVPFVQASAAERLKVSVAMAMAANPEVRVICIKDASLLDSDSRTTLATMAAERDYQLWLEVVGDGGPTGVVIEDGKVSA